MKVNQYRTDILSLDGPTYDPCLLTHWGYLYNVFKIIIIIMSLCGFIEVTFTSFESRRQLIRILNLRMFSPELKATS